MGFIINQWLVIPKDYDGSGNEILGTGVLREARSSSAVGKPAVWLRYRSESKKSRRSALIQQRFVFEVAKLADFDFSYGVDFPTTKHQELHDVVRICAVHT